MTARPNNVERLIECCICCDYLNDVRETPCCHQLFCQLCIRSWLENSNTTCPRCRASNLTVANLLQNIVIQRFVDDLLFDCPFKIEGCPAQVPRVDLEVHKQTCAYSSERLRQERQRKLTDLKGKLHAYRSSKTRVDDRTFFELAKSFHAAHQYDSARDCITSIKKPKLIAELVLLEAQIEYDDNNYAAALTFYDQALAVAKTNPSRISILLAKGQIHLKTAQYAQAKENFHRALDLLDRNGDPQTRAEVLNSCGLLAKKCSEFDQAILAYNEAFELVDSQSELCSEIMSNLADIHRKKGNHNEARDLYLKSLKQVEARYGDNHPSVADIMNNLGMLTKKEGKYNEAINYLKQAIKISRHYYGREHPSIGIYLTNIGDVYRKQSDFKKAEATYQEALLCLEKTFGPNHIEVAEVLNSMGLILKKRADYDGAEQYYLRAIDIVRQTFGENQEHYKLGIYRNNLADLDRKRNRFDRALELYQKALKSIEKTLGPQHIEAAEILHNIGQVHHQLGNYPAAIDYINRALIIIKKEFDDKHYKYGMFLNSLGLAYAMIDDYSTAYVHLKEALQTLLVNLGQDHIEVCDVYGNLGDVCMKLVAECELNNSKAKTNLQNKETKLDEAKKYYTQAQRIAFATFGAEHTKTKQYLSLLFIVDNYFSL